MERSSKGRRMEAESQEHVSIVAVVPSLVHCGQEAAAAAVAASLPLLHNISLLTPPPALGRISSGALGVGQGDQEEAAAAATQRQ